MAKTTQSEDFARRGMQWVGLAALLISGCFSGGGTSDAAKLETLQALLAEYRECVKSGKLAEFGPKAKEAVQPMIAELQRTADAKHPWRQKLLWAAQNRLPEMFGTDKKAQEKAVALFEAHLYDAAVGLGLARGEPPKLSSASQPAEESSNERSATE